MKLRRVGCVRRVLRLIVKDHLMWTVASVVLREEAPRTVEPVQFVALGAVTAQLLQSLATKVVASGGR